MAGVAAPAGRSAAQCLGRQQADRPVELHRSRPAQWQRPSQMHRRVSKAQAGSTADAAAAAPASHSAARAPPNRSPTSAPGSSMSSLATYRLPQRRAPQRWLDACIRDAVANLDEAPFLQATSMKPEPQLRRFRVSPDVGDAPQLWEGIVRHLSDSGTMASSVVYVSPVVVGETAAQEAAVSCLATAACDSAREVLTGIAASATGEPVLTGRVGDCCHGAGADHSHVPLAAGSVGATQPQHFSSMGASLDSLNEPFGSGAHAPPDAFKHGYAKASQIVPYVPLRRGRSVESGVVPDNLPEGRMRAGSMRDGELQRLWGVVVQSREHGGMEGCYVLKTTSSTAADCKCTSYTLTKVCEGDHARKQLSGAWI